MANVIVGFIASVLFIGLALAGATYYGPKVQSATFKGAASMIVAELVSISGAVQNRDSAEERVTQAGSSVAFLSPSYLDEAPKNPSYGPEPMLLSATGDLTGAARVAAMKVEGQNDTLICDEINKYDNGTTAPFAGGPSLTKRIGAYRLNRTLTPGIDAGSCIAYAMLP